jgi:hypothetical protein
VGLLVAAIAACTPRAIDVPAREDAGATGAPGASPTQPGSVPTTPPPASTPTCGGDDAAFVRRAFEAVLGRRPHGTEEARVFVALGQAVDRVAARPGAGRAAIVDALTRENGYLPRWTEVYRDALLVQRTGPVANVACFEPKLRPDTASAARFVRDHAATEIDAAGPFTMGDVVDGALRIDDVSPIYLGNLFAMMARTFTGANAAALSLEHARRADFGGRFDAAYLHRDGVCLRCHNGESSVTFRDDPATNRHFPLPGRLEGALFGVSTGVPDDGTHDGVQRMRAVLRYDGVVGGGVHPWGGDKACGSFKAEAEIADDFAGVDGKFGGLTGQRVSVWGLERSLRRGFARLREHGLTRGPNGLVPDSDEAFAYLVAANIVERVWEEIVGSRLTIATSFPRNAAAEAQLLALTETFVASGFSHRALLQKIAASPAFDPPPTNAACLPTPYALPAIYDPWITEEPAERRGNGPGDAVAARSSRTLLRATYDALGWTWPKETSFPDYDTPLGQFQAEIGVPLRSTIPGFRGLDFGARLSWEQHVGACKNPDGTPDFVDQLLIEGAATPQAKVRDVLIALKDRLLGEPTLGTSESALAAALIEAPLEAPVSSLGAAQKTHVRRFCGVLLASPQMLLQGLAAEPVTTLPVLTLPGDRQDAVCQKLRTHAPAGYRVTCEAGVPVVQAKPASL